NLVLAEPVFLNRRLAHAQRINAVADGLNRLSYGLILQLGEHLRLHRENVCTLGSRTQVVLGQALRNDILQVGASTRWNALQHDLVGTVLRIGLGDIGKGNLALVELLFEDFDSVVGISVDRVIHLHLQDEVGSALQIESQVNALGHGIEQALAGNALRNTEYPEQKDEQNYDDE